MKKAISLILAVLLTATLTAPAFAADYDATSGVCGDNMTWSFEGDTLTITGTGRMWDFENLFASDTPNDSPWLWKKPKTVNISEGVTYIGSYAFQRCTAKTVNLPSTLTEIGEYAFKRADIKTASLPEGIQVIGDGAFNLCYSLSSINLPDSLTRIGSAAFSGAGITSVKIPDGITVLEDWTFGDCSKLQSVILPDGLTAIGDSTFTWCKKLTSLTIPDSVRHIGAAFDGSGLTSLTIPDGVTAIEDAAFWGGFETCPSQLKTITIPGSVTRIGEIAFEFCDKLTDVYYGGSREQWDAITIEDGNDPLSKATIHCSDAYVPTPVAGFSDVVSNDYFAPAVQWAVENNVTNGIGGGLFGADAPLTRAQAVTFLWRASGCPEPTSASSIFTDVTDPNAYYYKAVLWAVENGITNGVGDNRFGNDSSVTRGQMITFLWRTMGKPGEQAGGEWYTAPESWAKENGLLSGTAEEYTTNGVCPRADVVYYLWREWN